MIGSESIDIGLENIWRSWFAFRKGKRRTAELENFEYHVEENLYTLFEDLNVGEYRHGVYKKFIVRDNKQREISVASIRDRIVHRLVYDYLVPFYDKTFIYDAWSCRKNKGLLGAIERTQSFLRRYSRHFVWKGDVEKFFDNVDHAILLKIISCILKDKKALDLITKIIYGFNTHTHTLARQWARHGDWQSHQPDFRQYLFE
jgi:retron-type reverse transcriptase